MLTLLFLAISLFRWSASEASSPCNSETLSLTLRSLTAFPDISTCTALQILDLGSNALTAIPAEIGLLVNLQYLYLDYNQLTTLPAEIGQLVNLKELALYYNQLTAIPPEIGQLVNLQSLSLENNQLTTLPAEIGLLTNLTELNFPNNLMTTFPVAVGQLTNLKYMELYGNQLTTLPSEIWQLVNLLGLSLDDNLLTNIPPEIGLLVNLEGLNLPYNQLINLPAEIGQLVNLQDMYLNDNQLTTLPAEIGQLINIQFLYLENNQLTTLPPEIGQLASLQVLSLENNPLTCVPLSVVAVAVPQFPACESAPSPRPTAAPSSAYTWSPSLSPAAIPSVDICAECSCSPQPVQDFPPRGIHRVDGYVVQRARGQESCAGQVRNVSGVAYGCLDYAISTCVEVDNTVVVTKRFLDYQDPRSLHCEPGAPEVWVDISVHARCDKSSGIATSCATLEATQVPYPRKHAGMVSLEFRDDEQCHSYLANPKVAPLPRTFQHARNAACLWDPRYGFWYRESCNGAADTLTFTVYTDSACKKKITRPNVISLHSQTPGLNQCIAHYEANHTLQGYRTTYCHL